MDDDALDLPEKVRDPFRVGNPYAVPMSVLVGGVHVEVAQQVLLHPSAPKHLVAHTAPIHAHVR